MQIHCHLKVNSMPIISTKGFKVTELQNSVNECRYFNLELQSSKLKLLSPVVSNNPNADEIHIMLIIILIITRSMPLGST